MPVPIPGVASIAVGMVSLDEVAFFGYFSENKTRDRYADP
jgi:hypothetical protein